MNWGRSSGAWEEVDRRERRSGMMQLQSSVIYEINKKYKLQDKSNQETHTQAIKNVKSPGHSLLVESEMTFKSLKLSLSVS